VAAFRRDKAKARDLAATIDRRDGSPWRLAGRQSAARRLNT
jgi:hypothetical protein